MTGRHAATPDELFDQRERERAGSHRADVEPLGPDGLPVDPQGDIGDGSVPADADLKVAKAPARKKSPAVPKTPASTAAASKSAASTPAPAKPAPQKKAST